MDTLNNPVRESLIDFVKMLRHLAQEGADLPSANNDDKRILGDDAELLASSVESLAKIIETQEAYVLWMSEAWQAMRPEEKAKLKSVPGPFDLMGLVDLSSALFAAFRIGARVLESPIIKRMEQETVSARAATARKYRTEKSKEQTALIESHAKQLGEQHPGWSARRVAREIIKKTSIDLKPNTVEGKINEYKKMRSTE